jgi:predicted 2-oxoglutarate/Fe(II)-dependent dioxygenase YbiX
MSTPILDHLPDFVVIPKVISQSDCLDYVRQYQGLITSPSETYSGLTDKRSSSELRVPETDRVVTTIINYVNNLNQHVFKFDITGVEGDIRLLKYCSPGDRFVWHCDRTDGIPVRKLSFSLQLSDPATYKGGVLQIHNGETVDMPRELGTLIVFPSYVLHQVTEITMGERYALTGWMTGPPFK